MATKTYTKGWVGWPGDTRTFTASTNYTLLCAEGMSGYNAFIDLEYTVMGSAIYCTVIYSTT